jgi:hypothetical protein
MRNQHRRRADAHRDDLQRAVQRSYARAMRLDLQLFRIRRKGALSGVNASRLIFPLQSEAVVKLKETLAQPLRRMQEIARRIATVSNECKIALVPDEYVQSFKMEMMDAVFKWCGGATFSEICKVRTRAVVCEFVLTFRLSDDRHLRGIHYSFFPATAGAIAADGWRRSRYRK